MRGQACGVQVPRSREGLLAGRQIEKVEGGGSRQGNPGERHPPDVVPEEPDVHEKTAVLCADDPKAMAKRIANLLTDGARWKKASLSAAKFAERNFSQAAVTAKMRAIQVMNSTRSNA